MIIKTFEYQKTEDEFLKEEWTIDQITNMLIDHLRLECYKLVVPFYANKAKIVLEKKRNIVTFYGTYETP